MRYQAAPLPVFNSQCLLVLSFTGRNPSFKMFCPWQNTPRRLPAKPAILIQHFSMTSLGRLTLTQMHNLGMKETKTLIPESARYLSSKVIY
tara:strand:+ start:430 stop:702 length:273 start_codon:yes stop_codon:yes gene_type:complete